MLYVEIHNLITVQKKKNNAFFHLIGMNISLLVEIQAAAENVLAALVFARKSLSVISKTISPFKYVSQLYTHYTAFVNPKSKHKSQFLKERNYSNSTTLHLQWQSQTTDLHL